MKSVAVSFVFVLLSVFGCNNNAQLDKAEMEKLQKIYPATVPLAELKISNSEDEHKKWIEENTKKAESLSQKFGVVDAPDVNVKTGTDYNWRNTLALALENMQYGAESGDTWKERRFQIMGAHGLLQQISVIESEKLRRAVTAVFLSKTLRKKMYEWAFPSISIAFKEMYAQDRRDYLAILKHARRYMDTADFKLEEEYLQSLSSSDKDQCHTEAWQKKFFKLSNDFACYETLFTYHGPKGGDDRFRKIETFIYRRVVEDGWPLADMKSVLEQLIADLERLPKD